jgi:hypothetical protein
MRAGAILFLLGITTLGAYSLGRQSAPMSHTPVAAVAAPAPAVVKPVAFAGSPQPPAGVQPSILSGGSLPPANTGVPGKPIAADTNPALPEVKPPAVKRKVEGALTAAAIAAILVQASRDQYHATGRACACPDDTMRNGRACGGWSAHSRPGGAAPLCYPHDVTAAMIESYQRQRQASR